MGDLFHTDMLPLLLRLSNIFWGTSEIGNCSLIKTSDVSRVLILSRESVAMFFRLSTRMTLDFLQESEQNFWPKCGEVNFILLKKIPPCKNLSQINLLYAVKMMLH